MSVALASQWTGPSLLVVEAGGWKRIPCSRSGRLQMSSKRPVWDFSPTQPICLKARWAKLTEAHSPRPPADTEAFLQRMGKDVYVSADSVPSGSASVLLIPGPIYGKLRPALTGVQIRARLVKPDEQFSQVDASALRQSAADDSVYPDTVRVDLRWTNWKVGHISEGPLDASALTLLVKRSCLPGPVALERCASYASFGRVGANPIPTTLDVTGTLTFALLPKSEEAVPLLGTLLLAVRASPDSTKPSIHERLEVRVGATGLEETRLVR